MTRRMLAAACAALLAAAPLAGQSLFGTAGLGVPVQPVDAVGRALGGVGVGLWDFGGSVVNPALGAGLQRRGASVSLENLVLTTDFAGATDRTAATRFPQLQVVVPLGTVVLHAAYGGFLDQSWAVESRTPVPIGGGDVVAQDLFESVGGISQLRLGLGYAISPTLGVGAAIGYFGGEQDYRVTRRFEDPSNAGLLPYRQRWVRSYSAPLVSLGTRWSPSRFLRTGASVTWGGELTTRAQVGDPPPADFTLPLQVAAGASALLAPTVIVSAGGEWAGWGATEHGSDAWRMGGGAEFRGARLRERVLPLRVGGSFASLPFAPSGQTGTPTEWTAALGAGLILAGEAEAALATGAATIERGGRSAGQLSDAFWRFTVTFSVFGR
jgi:hypothetical protein